jgi:hypothetical protein
LPRLTAPAAALHGEGHEQVAREKRAHLGGELGADALGLFLQRQKGPEALPRKVAFGDAMAVRLDLRQKPGCAGVMVCQTCLLPP